METDPAGPPVTPGPRFLVEDPRFRIWAITLGTVAALTALIVLPNLLHPG